MVARLVPQLSLPSDLTAGPLQVSCFGLCVLYSALTLTLVKDPWITLGHPDNSRCISHLEIFNGVGSIKSLSLCTGTYPQVGANESRIS